MRGEISGWAEKRVKSKNKKEYQIKGRYKLKTEICVKPKTYLKS